MAVEGASRDGQSGRVEQAAYRSIQERSVAKKLPTSLISSRRRLQRLLPAIKTSRLEVWSLSQGASNAAGQCTYTHLLYPILRWPCSHRFFALVFMQSLRKQRCICVAFRLANCRQFRLRPQASQWPRACKVCCRRADGAGGEAVQSSLHALERSLLSRLQVVR